MPAPVRHTCPDIDKVLKRIKSAIKYADEGKNITENNTEEWDRFDYVIDELYGLEYEIEKLRSANSELRDWGEELEKTVNENLNIISDLEEKLNTA